MLYERLQKMFLPNQRKPLANISNRSSGFFKKKKVQDPYLFLRPLFLAEITKKTEPLQRDIRILQGLIQATKEPGFDPSLQTAVRNAVIEAIADFEKLPGAHNFAVNKDETYLPTLLQDFLENLTEYASKLVSIQAAEARRFHLTSFDMRIESINSDIQRHEESYVAQFATDAPRGYYLLHSPKSQRSVHMQKSNDLNQLDLHPTLKLLIMKHASQTDMSVSNIYDFYYDFDALMKENGVHLDIAKDNGAQKRDFTILKHSEYSAQIILTAHIDNYLIESGDNSEPNLRIAKKGEHLLSVEVVLDISSNDLGKTYEVTLPRFNYFSFDPELAKKIEAVHESLPTVNSHQSFECRQ